MRTAIDKGGKIYVAWLAVDDANGKGIITLSESSDKGVTFVHSRVTGANDVYVCNPSICVTDNLKVHVAFNRYSAFWDDIDKAYLKNLYELRIAERTPGGKLAETLIYGPYRCPRYEGDIIESPAMCAGQDANNVFIMWRDIPSVPGTSLAGTPDTSTDLFGATYPAIGNKVLDEGSTLDFTVHATDDGRPLTYSIYPGGDLNHNGSLDTNDISGILNLIWAEKGSVNWNGEADMSGDGAIYPIDYLMAMTSYTNKLTGLPAGLSIDKYTGHVTWTPTYKQSGAYQVIFRASDGASVASEMITITVNNVNAPPAVGTITPAQGVSAPGTGNEVLFTTTYTDLDGAGTISIADFLVNNPALNNTINAATDYKNCFLGFYTSADGKLSMLKDDGVTATAGITPGTAGVIGNSYASLDGSRSSVTKAGDTLTIKWAVTFKEPFSGKTYKTYLISKDEVLWNSWAQKGTWTVNRKPVLIPRGNTECYQNVNLKFFILGTDGDTGARLTYSVTGLPGATMNSATGEFNWKPASLGTYSATFSVSDGMAVDSQTVAIKVTPPPDLTFGSITAEPSSTMSGASGPGAGSVKSKNYDFYVYFSNIGGGTVSSPFKIKIYVKEGSVTKYIATQEVPSMRNNSQGLRVFTTALEKGKSYTAVFTINEDKTVYESNYYNNTKTITVNAN